MQLLSAAVNHTAVPVSDAYLRSKIIFGLNIMRPVKFENDTMSNSSSVAMTDVTTISHAQYAGVSPYIVGYSMPFGMYSFMLQLKRLLAEDAAKRGI